MKALVDQLKWVGVGEAERGSGMECESWLTPGRFAALLGLFMLAAYRGGGGGEPLLLLSRFWSVSYQLAHYTRASFVVVRRMAALGWTENNCGLQLLAQMELDGVLSAFADLSPAAAAVVVELLLLLHLFLAGLTMYGLAYHLDRQQMGGGCGWAGLCL